MFCRKCGVELKADAQFCYKCGCAVKDKVATDSALLNSSNKRKKNIIVGVITIVALALILTLCLGMSLGKDDTHKYAEAIIGKWQTTDDSWGLFTYTFYTDGYCKGVYNGHVSGVEPSLYPNSYYEGCGSGYWSFVEGEFGMLLKVEYAGDRSGDGKSVMYYEFEFNKDYTELVIHGVDTYWGQNRGTAVWTKDEE